jgi:hypothetical protein
MGNIIALLIVLAGVVGLIMCLRSVSRNRSTFKWPTTTGKVVSSMVKTIGFGDDLRQRAEIIYEYEIADKKLQSGRVSFADDYSDAQLTDAQIQEKVKKYSIGEEVTVYFDPSDPRECVLEPKQNNTMYLMMAVCGIVIAGALWYSVATNGRPTPTREQLAHPLGGGDKKPETETSTTGG